MPVNETYRGQLALLIWLLPQVAQEESFALKGGTAINLFIRDLPRLSVDIDLTYLPIKSYKDSLADIDAAMKRIENKGLSMPGRPALPFICQHGCRFISLPRSQRFSLQIGHLTFLALR
jgi:hypothetical protein